jgi:hypothetical protein
VANSSLFTTGRTRMWVVGRAILGTILQYLAMQIFIDGAFKTLPTEQIAALLIGVCGTVFVVSACTTIARDSNYHWTLGLAGLVPVIGPLVLLFLPRRAREEERRGFDVMTSGRDEPG